MVALGLSAVTRRTKKMHQRDAGFSVRLTPESAHQLEVCRIRPCSRVLGRWVSSRQRPLRSG